MGFFQTFGVQWAVWQRRAGRHWRQWRQGKLRAASRGDAVAIQPGHAGDFAQP